MVLAVLQQHAGVRLHSHDVFAATVGGARLTEPGNDVAIALAIASAWLGEPLARTWSPSASSASPASCAGSGRRRRLAEAARLGFRSALVPAEPPRRAPGNSRVLDGMRVVDVDNIARALTLLGLEKSDGGRAAVMSTESHARATQHASDAHAWPPGRPRLPVA